MNGKQRLTKTSLIHRIQKSSSLTKAQATEAVEAVFDAVTHALRNGDDVALANIGTLRVVTLDERQVRNPATGEYRLAEPTNVVRWRSAPALKAFINNTSGRDTLVVKAPKSY